MKRATLFLMQLVLAALILMGVTFPALAQESVKTAGLDPDELKRFLDEFFAEQVAELNVPGVTITFVQDDEILLSKAYGFADVEEQIPVSAEETVFRIGSVSKLFVATAVMQLVGQGKLDLHTDVNHYLTNFQLDDNYPQPVTLAHLLTHTAGFSDYWSGVAPPIQPRFRRSESIWNSTCPRALCPLVMS
jgi:CubicO group peptidase (beta-lactamase class C family)